MSEESVNCSTRRLMMRQTIIFTIIFLLISTMAFGEEAEPPPVMDEPNSPEMSQAENTALHAASESNEDTSPEEPAEIVTNDTLSPDPQSAEVAQSPRNEDLSETVAEPLSDESEQTIDVARLLFQEAFDTSLEENEPPQEDEGFAYDSDDDVDDDEDEELAETLSGEDSLDDDAFADREESPARKEALPSVEELFGESSISKELEAATDELEKDAELTAGNLFQRHGLQNTERVFRGVVERFDRSLETLERLQARTSRQEPSQGYLTLDPYIADPRWVQAMTDLRADRCKEALETADKILGDFDYETAEVAIQYAYARIQMCAGPQSQGRARMEKLATLDSAVGDLARMRLGQRVNRSGGDSSAGVALRTKLARALDEAAQGKTEQALEELDDLHRTLTSAGDRARVRLAQAQILENAGEIEEASARYLALYRRTHGWRLNAEIERNIRRLERSSKTQILSYGERIDQMVHQILRGRYREARQISVQNARERGVSGNEIRGWTFFRQALEAEHRRNRQQAADLFAQADRLVRDPEVRPRLYFGWARALRRLDRDDEAIALYDRLCKEFPACHLCDQSKYEAGRLLQFQNKHEEALVRFDSLLKTYPDSEWAPDALWRKAFSLYLTGQYLAAIPPLEEIVREYPNLQDESELTLGLKATYWMGVSYLKAGQSAKARTYLQRTIDRGTLTWYGRLAVARMEESGMRPRISLPRQQLSHEDLQNLATLRVPAHPRLEIAAELVRLGLWEDALSEMRGQVAMHPVPDGAHRLLAATYLTNDRPDWAHWIMRRHIEESGPDYVSLRDWGTAFPLHFMDLARQFGDRFGVSPYLVQAIMRQESGFRPAVRSPAGAVGLMQLMPGTARFTAQRFFSDERFNVRQLTRPEINVRLGTMYIRIHTAHAHNQIPLALAGYNAGPGALRSWMERYSDRELDAFVESITYQEARGYVRKVMTSFITYQALYSGQLPALSLQVPERLATWGVVPDDEVIDSQEPISMLTP